MKATWQGHAFIEFVTKSQLLGQIPALWHIFFCWELLGCQKVPGGSPFSQLNESETDVIKLTKAN